MEDRHLEREERKKAEMRAFHVEVWTAILIEKFIVIADDAISAGRKAMKAAEVMYKEEDGMYVRNVNEISGYIIQ